MIKLIAYYLPQYHPIPENDQWWEKGFTEWTNVAKAKPLFKGHYQPRLPGDLSFYDLRLSEVREQQAEMAEAYGVHGFCYYHYWFGNGKQLIERPFNEVLASGKPDFPFMLCWANQTWKGVWFGASKGKLLIEQSYPGITDYHAHFDYLQKAFDDPRYIKIDDKPVFNVYMPRDIPDLKVFVDVFRERAVKAGCKGIYLLASNCSETWNPQAHGFDGVISNNFGRSRHYAAERIVKDRKTFAGKLESRVRYFLGNKAMDDRIKPHVVDYKKFTDIISRWPDEPFDYFPMVVPDWDNSARAGRKSYILKGSNPELWADHLKSAVDYVNRKQDSKEIIFIKSWNEWAEGNYLEPDSKWGRKYLEAMKKVMNAYS